MPFIGGTITDCDGEPIAGATVRLSRCVFGLPQPAGEQLTGPDGGFSFGSLVSSAEYVVHVPLTGVLGGLVPTATTLNPSWVILGSQGDDHVDMAFDG